MGEKETMTAEEKNSGHATEQFARSAPSFEGGRGISSPTGGSSDRGDAEGDDPGDGPLDSIALNSSRSNIYRMASPGSEGGEPPEPAESAIVKSKSNITNN